MSRALDTTVTGAEGVVHSPVSIEYSQTFEAEKRQVTEKVLAWGHGDRLADLDLDFFESCILVKNSERVVVYANAAFRKMIAGGAVSTGASTDGYFTPGDQRISQITDELIVGGVKSIQLEHAGRDIAGQRYLFVTHKRRLDELEDPNLCFLVICRPVCLDREAPHQRRRELSEQLVVYGNLDSTDQTICRMYYHGESTKTIAEFVGFTTRSVEIRRQKILDAFDLQKPVDIVKLLTRLEEHSLIRLPR